MLVLITENHLNNNLHHNIFSSTKLYLKEIGDNSKSGKFNTNTTSLKMNNCSFLWFKLIHLFMALDSHSLKINEKKKIVKLHLPFFVVSPRPDLKDLHAPILLLAPYMHHRNPQDIHFVPSF